MTDKDDAVRRLLADVRHDEPIPADVAARMDQVLAGLAAERAEDAAPIPLRTRRRWPQALLAAAAVVVIGFGIGQVLPGDSPEAGDAVSSQAESDSSATREDAGSDQSRDEADQESQPQAPGQGEPSESLVPGQLPRLEELDEESLLALRATTLTSANLDSFDATSKAARCGTTELAEGDLARLARHQGRVVEVVYHPVGEGLERVTVRGCDAPAATQAPWEVLASVVIRVGE